MQLNFLSQISLQFHLIINTEPDSVQLLAHFVDIPFIFDLLGMLCQTLPPKGNQ